MIIKQARERKGMTQSDLSKALKLTSPQFVSNIERGLAELPVMHFKKVSRMLDIPMDKLIDMKVERTHKLLKKAFKLR